MPIAANQWLKARHLPSIKDVQLRWMKWSRLTSSCWMLAWAPGPETCDIFLGKLKPSRCISISLGSIQRWIQNNHELAVSICVSIRIFTSPSCIDQSLPWYSNDHWLLHAYAVRSIALMAVRATSSTGSHATMFSSLLPRQTLRGSINAELDPVTSAICCDVA